MALAQHPTFYPAEGGGRPQGEQHPVLSPGAGFLSARGVSNDRSPPLCLPSRAQASHSPLGKGQRGLARPIREMRGGLLAPRTRLACAWPPVSATPRSSCPASAALPQLLPPCLAVLVLGSQPRVLALRGGPRHETGNSPAGAGQDRPTALSPKATPGPRLQRLSSWLLGHPLHPTGSAARVVFQEPPRCTERAPKAQPRWGLVPCVAGSSGRSQLHCSGPGGGSAEYAGTLVLLPCLPK